VSGARRDARKIAAAQCAFPRVRALQHSALGTPPLGRFIVVGQELFAQSQTAPVEYVESLLSAIKRVGAMAIDCHDCFATERRVAAADLAFAMAESGGGLQVSAASDRAWREHRTTAANK